MSQHAYEGARRTRGERAGEDGSEAEGGDFLTPLWDNGVQPTHQDAETSEVSKTAHCVDHDDAACFTQPGSRSRREVQIRHEFIEYGLGPHELSRDHDFLGRNSHQPDDRRKHPGYHFLERQLPRK